MTARVDDGGVGGSPVRLETPRLVLVVLGPRGAARMAGYQTVNRGFHEAWNPPRGEAFYTPAFWRTRLAEQRTEFTAGNALQLTLLSRDDERHGAVLGTLGFTRFEWRATSRCQVGYALAQAAEGRGLMFEALTAGLAYVVGKLGVHRVSADYNPLNERSGAVLRRAGFETEGYAKRFLYSNGAWKDQVRTAYVAATDAPPRAEGPGPWPRGTFTSGPGAAGGTGAA